MARDARSMIAGAREKRLAVDKFPMLAKLADDMADHTIDALRTRLSTPVQFRRVDIASDREETLLSTLGADCLAAILHDPEWGCNFAALLQADFVYTLVEVMLGSDGSDAPFTDQRSFSTIERGLSTSFMDAFVTGVSRGVTPMQALALEFEKFDARLDFVTLGAKGDDAVAIRYRMEALSRSGDIILVIPQRAIARIGAQLAESPATAPRRPDPQWAKDFEERVTGAEIAVSIFTEIAGYRLLDIARLRPGQVLTLPEKALHDITLTAEGRRLFTCELGQSEGRYSVRIAAEYDPDAARKNAVHALGS